MKILMEDWLIGCVHHDGRHGEVILPTIKVLEIADYIRRTRTSQTDGCLEIPPTDEFVEKELKKVLKRNLEQTFPISEQTEPSTELIDKALEWYENKRPSTDCSWKKGE